MAFTNILLWESMSTLNTTISSQSWTKLVDAMDTDFLITWDVSKIVEVASTDEDTPPIINGHRFSHNVRITRDDTGAGYVWARLVDSTGGASFRVTVSKTTSSSGATGGFDSTEGVHKVAMLVWNSDTLAWERAANSAGGGGSSGAVLLTKRIDIGTTYIYSGTSSLGSTESSTNWTIQRIELNLAGDPIAIKISIGSWDNRSSLTYL